MRNEKTEYGMKKDMEEKVAEQGCIGGQDKKIEIWERRRDQSSGQL